MKRYVLDTSVVIKWFSEYDEDDLEKALALRQALFDGECKILAPDLLLYELSNALRFNPRLTMEDVNQAVQSVIDMGFEIRAAEPEILERAINTAFKFRITVYDAYYLALAQTGNAPLITADYKMAGRLKGFKQVVRLSEF